MKWNMKRFVRTSAVWGSRLGAAVVAVLGVDRCEAQLPIVRENQTVAAVVIPASPNVSERLAAEAMVTYLTMAGTRPTVISDDVDVPRPAISIGRTRLAATAAIDDRGLVHDGYRIRAIGDVVYVIGRDVPPPEPAAFYMNRGITGTYKGALALLEELGIRFVQPSPAGIHIPSDRNLSLDSALDVTHRPPFAYAYFGRPEWGDWNTANNFRLATNLFTGGGHTWEEFLSADLYAEHPEYFRMEDGQRIRPTVQGAFFLCPSNEDVARLITDAIRKRFDQGYDLVELGQSDGYMPCQCDRCKALDRPGEHHEQVHLLHQKVAAELGRSHPDKRVMALIYPPTHKPSRFIDQYGPNVVLEVCDVAEDNLSRWSAKAPAGLTSYVYYMGPPSQQGSAPRFTPKMAQEEVRTLVRHQVQGIYFCGGGGNWGAEGPTHYALGRLLGDPSLQADDLLQEYCRLTFGGAAEAMVRFYQLWYERIESTFRLRAREHFVAAYPPQVLERLQSLLAMAKGQAGEDGRAQGWIESALLSLDHVRHIANVFHAYGGYEVAPSTHTLAILHDKVSRHMEYSRMLSHIDGERPAFVKDFLPGWNFYWQRAAYGSIASNHSSLNAPFGWDFETIMAKGILPGTARPQVVAGRRMSDITLDGRLDDPGWGAAEWQELGQASLGSIRAKTRFAVTYDDERLYVAFECEEPLIETMVVQDFGRDGAVYATECVELFLDPTASSLRMMHLIATPTETGLYDGKFGYIDDPLHPLVIAGREDTSWNPQWQHACHIDPGRRLWTVELAVPFASLGESTPLPGQRWRFNVGRERHPGNFRGGTPSMFPDLYLWSPNLESQLFCVPAIFGDLHFDRNAMP
jgi:hypothetical protein